MHRYEFSIVTDQLGETGMRIMRINFVSTMLALWIVLGSVPVWAACEGGTGTPDDPYQIATAAQLISIGGDLDALEKHFVLVADIDLDPALPGGRTFDRAPLDWPMRMGASVTRLPFNGVFDGAGHVIRSMVINGKGKGIYISSTSWPSTGGPQGKDRPREMPVVYNKQGYPSAGLFALIGASGCVKNLGLEDVDMPCVIEYAGCLAGSS